MELLIVTGLSGSGKSCVIKTLEDIGYFCVDNLPCRHIPVFAELINVSAEAEKVAVVTDIRAELTDEELIEAADVLTCGNIPFHILYLDCSENVLLNRYKQSRRIHPLMKGETDTLVKAIAAEKAVLSPLKTMADYVIDTSELTFFDCRNRILSLFSENLRKQMSIHCVSFGFKHGIPRDADYIFDVRFLPNPYYVPELKEKTGLDEQVRGFVMNNSIAEAFEENLHSLIMLAASECAKDGRNQLVIGIGCTGGHHRSVTFVERLCSKLKENDYNVSVNHRDINK